MAERKRENDRPSGKGNPKRGPNGPLLSSLNLEDISPRKGEKRWMDIFNIIEAPSSLFFSSYLSYKYIKKTLHNDY